MLKIFVYKNFLVKFVYWYYNDKYVNFKIIINVLFVWIFLVFGFEYREEQVKEDGYKFQFYYG